MIYIMNNTFKIFGAMFLFLFVISLTGSHLAYGANYTLTTNASPTSGGTVSPLTGNYASGTNVTLNETANSGYQFTSWSGSGPGNYTGSETSPTITINGNITETANFENVYPLTVSSSGNGLISVDSGNYVSSFSENVPRGDYITVSANPDANYEFSNWTGTYNSTLNPFSFNSIPLSMDEVANFKSTLAIVNYTVTASATPTGLISINSGNYINNESEIFASGSNITLHAYPDEYDGYEFKNWTGVVDSINYNLSLTVTSNVIEYANFITVPTVTNYTLTASGVPTNEGFISMNSGNWISSETKSFNSGTVVNLKESPNTGYEFINWTGVGTNSYSGNATNINITMNSNTTETASFKTIPTTYNLGMKINNATFGTITPSVGNYVYNNNTVVDISAVPNSGYEFVEWNGTGIGNYTGTSNSIELTINHNKTEEAVFEKIPTTINYTLTMNILGSGSISPATGSYKAGSIVKITATPGSNYTFVKWIGSGNESYSGLNESVNITMNSNITESAYFVKIGNFAYITAGSNSNNIYIMNLSTDTIIKNITGFDNPYGIAISSNDKYAYVTNNFNGKLSIVNLSTDLILKNITGFINPIGITLSSNGKYAYVLNDGNSSISILNLSTDTIIKNIPVKYNFGWGIALNSNNTYGYVTFSDSNGILSIVNLSTDTIIKNITGFNYPFGLALSSNNLYAYVLNGNTHNLTVVNLSTDTIIKNITGFGGADGIAISSNGKYAYVANGNETLSILNLSTDTIIRNIKEPFQPESIALYESNKNLIIPPTINQINYTVKVNASPSTEGHISINTENVIFTNESFTFKNGTSIYINALPDSTYKFVNWTGTIYSSNSILSFTVNKNISEIAHFSNITKITPIMNLSVCHNYVYGNKGCLIKGEIQANMLKGNLFVNNKLIGTASNSSVFYTTYPSAGNYNIVFNTTGNSNYSQKTMSESFTIEKATPTYKILIKANGMIYIINNTTPQNLTLYNVKLPFNVSYFVSSIYNQVPFSLYLNNKAISNNIVSKYYYNVSANNSLAKYTFIMNTSGNNNYTSVDPKIVIYTSSKIEIKNTSIFNSTVNYTSYNKAKNYTITASNLPSNINSTLSYIYISPPANTSKLYTPISNISLNETYIEINSTTSGGELSYSFNNIKAGTYVFKINERNSTINQSIYHGLYVYRSVPNIGNISENSNSINLGNTYKFTYNGTGISNIKNISLGLYINNYLIYNITNINETANFEIYGNGTATINGNQITLPYNLINPSKMLINNASIYDYAKGNINYTNIKNNVLTFSIIPPTLNYTLEENAITVAPIPGNFVDNFTVESSSKTNILWESLSPTLSANNNFAIGTSPLTYNIAKVIFKKYISYLDINNLPSPLISNNTNKIILWGIDSNLISYNNVTKLIHANLTIYSPYIYLNGTAVNFTNKPYIKNYENNIEIRFFNVLTGNYVSENVTGNIKLDYGNNLSFNGNYKEISINSIGTPGETEIINGNIKYSSTDTNGIYYIRNYSYITGENSILIIKVGFKTIYYSLISMIIADSIYALGMSYFIIKIAINTIKHVKIKKIKKNIGNNNGKILQKR